MVKSGQAWAGTIVTLDATGALAAASVGPAGVLYVDGTANGASVTITGSNPYKWSVTLPSLTAGQSVSMYVTATVGGIATAAVVAEDIADTKRVSDLNDSAYAGGAVASVTGDVGGKVLGGGVSSITGTGVRAVDGSGNAIAPASATTDIQARIPAALIAGRMDASVGVMQNNTLTAAALAADAVAEIAAAIGSTTGSGAISHTITVNDGAAPLDGVEVWISTDSGGTNVIAGTLTTNTSGQVTFTLDAGTYYAWMQLSGYDFTNPTAITVA